jgi:PPM family protein phosphatase
MHSSAGSAIPTSRRAAQQLRVTCAATSDRGRVRDENQDRFAILPEIGLAIVADGMGGQAAGEVAAQLAVQFVCESFVDDAPNSGAAQSWLVAAIERANHCIYGAAEQIPAYHGMGTTIAALLVHGTRAVVAHVGDSRVHRFRARQLTTLTEDHNLFNELVRHGLANPDLPEEHAKTQHLLTRALGTHATVDVDARLVDVAPGDVFLLSTDGLHGVVGQQALTEILAEHPHLDEAAERLVAQANLLGGPDNITAVLLKIA